MGEDIITDMVDLMGARGSVVTYSSNFGRALYWLKYLEIKAGLFLIESLDGAESAFGNSVRLPVGQPPDAGYFR